MFVILQVSLLAAALKHVGIFPSHDAEREQKRGGLYEVDLSVDNESELLFLAVSGL